MRGKLAIDSNLALLLVVGRAEEGLLSRHKRLRHFGQEDYLALLGYVSVAAKIVTTPNCLTEVSNLARFGIHGPSLDRVLSSLRVFVNACQEVHAESLGVSRDDQFDRLGLTDCAWLAMLGDGVTLLTVDDALHIEALRRGHDAVNFRHSRLALRSR
ncbi:MAG: hypothetical protein AB7O57_18455 [Hyphomicrobiaceae bacterium]